MQVIVYQNIDKTIVILTPTIELSNIVGITSIAEKDVPNDLPYWIVDSNIFPTDRSSRELWRLDGTEGTPHGFGGVSNEFSDEQLIEIFNKGLV